MLTKQKIKKLNEEFKALSKAEKRIQIAKDVIAQIKIKKITPNTGSYINLDFDSQFSQSQSVQEVIGDFECSCCALGACLLSTTKYLNKVTWGEIYYGEIHSKSNTWNLLKGLFTPEQLLMIETAFEKKNSYGVQRVGEDFFDGKVEHEIREKCKDFGLKYKTDRARLIGIMNNIINNKGIFKP